MEGGLGNVTPPTPGGAGGLAEAGFAILKKFLWGFDLLRMAYRSLGHRRRRDRGGLRPTRWRAGPGVPVYIAGGTRCRARPRPSPPAVITPSGSTRGQGSDRPRTSITRAARRDRVARLLRGTSTCGSCCGPDLTAAGGRFAQAGSSSRMLPRAPSPSCRRGHFRSRIL